MKRQPLRRIRRVERQIRRPRLENAEQPDHHLQRALDAQRHHALRPDPRAAQVMRQPVGVRLQRRVAQLAVPEHRRDRIRRRAPPAPRTAPASSRPAPPAPSRSSPPAARARSAPDRISRPAERRIRRRNRRPPAAGSAAPPAQPCWRGQTGRWRIPACRRSPRPRRRRRARRQKRQRQVELRASRVDTASNDAATPSSSKLNRRVVLERQHHLEQRMPRQRPRRVEHLDQPLKRNILVAVGRKIAGAHPRHQFAQARTAPTCRCAAPAC